MKKTALVVIDLQNDITKIELERFYPCLLSKEFPKSVAKSKSAF